VNGNVQHGDTGPGDVQRGDWNVQRGDQGVSAPGRKTYSAVTGNVQDRDGERSGR
jgi:hypothetical protein